MMPYLEQVQIGLGPRGYETVKSGLAADSTIFASQRDEAVASLLRLCPEHIWPHATHKAHCPHPILINQVHQSHLHSLHEALTVAVTDIVERWWSDTEANFPSRMPLAKEEEGLLQWIHDQVSQGRMKRFSDCRGSWRPDFLVKDKVGASGEENGEVFCITEINARFSFNGLLLEAFGQEALDGMCLSKFGLASATSPAQVFDGMMKLFQPGLPLHLLRGEEPGYDIHMFMDVMQRRYGVATRSIAPADLRLVPHPEAKGGFKLCCLVNKLVPLGRDGNACPAPAGAQPLLVADGPATQWLTDAGEMVEEVFQVGLELHQRELLSLDAEMVRQISLRCFNDMRTVLLVHDKRMLGLVKQEIGHLIDRGVLTSTQGRALEEGIADTVNPGSQRMGELLQLSKTDPELRNNHLLKPVRGGKGAGIKFGDEMSQKDWVAALEGLQSPALVPGVSCVVQRRITPRLYDVMLGIPQGSARYALVGTYHALHGKLLGLGVWRISPDRICSISTGGSWLCSVIRHD